MVLPGRGRTWWSETVSVMLRLMALVTSTQKRGQDAPSSGWPLVFSVSRRMPVQPQLRATVAQIVPRPPHFVSAGNAATGDSDRLRPTVSGRRTTLTQALRMNWHGDGGRRKSLWPLD